MMRSVGLLSKCALALLALLVLSCKKSQEQQEQRPNIVFIIADDLGWGNERAKEVVVRVFKGAAVTSLPSLI